MTNKRTGVSPIMNAYRSIIDAFDEAVKLLPKEEYREVLETLIGDLQMRHEGVVQEIEEIEEEP